MIIFILPIFRNFSTNLSTFRISLENVISLFVSPLQNFPFFPLMIPILPFCTKSITKISVSSSLQLSRYEHATWLHAKSGFIKVEKIDSTDLEIIPRCPHYRIEQQKVMVMVQVVMEKGELYSYAKREISGCNARTQLSIIEHKNEAMRIR